MMAEAESPRLEVGRQSRTASHAETGSRPSGSNAVRQDVRLPMMAEAEVAQARSRTASRAPPPSRIGSRPSGLNAVLTMPTSGYP